MSAPKQNPAPTLERMADVVRRTSLSKASIYRFINEGTFPKPLQIGPKRVAWLSAEIDSWIEQQFAQRNSQPQNA